MKNLREGFLQLFVETCSNKLSLLPKNTKITSLHKKTI